MIILITHFPIGKLDQAFVLILNGGQPGNMCGMDGTKDQVVELFTRQVCNPIPQMSMI